MNPEDTIQQNQYPGPTSYKKPFHARQVKHLTDSMSSSRQEQIWHKNNNIQAANQQHDWKQAATQQHDWKQAAAQQHDWKQAADQQHDLKQAADQQHDWKQAAEFTPARQQNRYETRNLSANVPTRNMSANVPTRNMSANAPTSAVLCPRHAAGAVTTAVTADHQQVANVSTLETKTQVIFV